MHKKNRLIALVSIIGVSLLLLSFVLYRAYFMQPFSSTGTEGQSTTTSRRVNGPVKLLVFSKTGGYRHSAIEEGSATIKKLADEKNVAVDFTEDATTFTASNLAQYQAVIFLLTSGDILDASQQAAFEGYIRAGGGYAGVHSASDTEYSWPWYGKLVGAYFSKHPHIQQATLNVIERTHVSTSMLPEQWIRTDEWYNFATNPREVVNVLITIDETTYEGGTMGSFHPMSWHHEYDGGRSWYTALGHTEESYRDPLFQAHLWGGIMHAAGNSA